MKIGELIASWVGYVAKYSVPDITFSRLQFTSLFDQFSFQPFLWLQKLNLKFLSRALTFHLETYFFIIVGVYDRLRGRKNRAVMFQLFVVHSVLVTAWIQISMYCN